MTAKELRSHGDMANPTPGVDSDVLSENGWRQLLRDNWILVRASGEYLNRNDMKKQNYHERHFFNRTLLVDCSADLIPATLLEHLPASVVLAVGYSVSGDPLVAAVLSALNLDVRHTNWPAEVHLKPLVDVVIFSRPSSCLAIPGLEIQPGVCWAVIWVPLRGGRNPGVRNRSAFHSQRLYNAFCWNLMGEISKYFWIRKLKPWFEYESQDARCERIEHVLNSSLTVIVTIP